MIPDRQAGSQSNSHPNADSSRAIRGIEASCNAQVACSPQATVGYAACPFP